MICAGRKGALLQNKCPIYKIFSPLPSIERRDLPIADPLDWLCALLDDLTAPRSPAARARYVRVARGFARPGAGAGAWLATETQRRIYDSGGDLIEVRDPSHLQISHGTRRAFRGSVLHAARADS